MADEIGHAKGKHGARFKVKWDKHSRKVYVSSGGLFGSFSDIQELASNAGQALTKAQAWVTANGK